MKRKPGKIRAGGVRRGSRLPVPDIDMMDLADIDAFLLQYRETPITTLARRMFPTEPLYFRLTARILFRMATTRRILMSGRMERFKYDLERQYNRMYVELPVWAKWRGKFPTLQLVRDGERFRKHPKSNPLDLLKGMDRKCR